MSKTRKKDNSTKDDFAQQNKSIRNTTIAVWVISLLTTWQAYQVAILLVVFAMSDEPQPLEHDIFWGTFWFLVMSLGYVGVMMTVRNQLLSIGSSAPNFTWLYVRVIASIRMLRLFTFAGTFASVILWYLNPDKVRLEPLSLMFAGYTVGIVYFQNQIWKPIEELHKQNQLKDLA
jgi:hypothetical protein